MSNDSAVKDKDQEAAGVEKCGSPRSSRISPYFKVVDLNRIGAGEFEDIRPHKAYEIGIKFTF